MSNLRGQLCDILRFICEIFVVWPLSFWTHFNTCVCPLTLNNFVSSDGSKITIQSPVYVWDCEDNRVAHIFEALDYVLEFIVIFKDG